MNELQQRILREGQILGNGILKVDSFVNHQVDPKLMDACGKEFARRFSRLGATKVLTAEISGIAPAVTTALHLDLPVVYARKTKPIHAGPGLSHAGPFAHQRPHGGTDRFAGVSCQHGKGADHR